MVVKITIDEANESAFILSQDRKVAMVVPIHIAKKKLPKETQGFFQAEINGKTGSLEIGDRQPDEKW